MSQHDPNPQRRRVLAGLGAAPLLLTAGAAAVGGATTATATATPKTPARTTLLRNAAVVLTMDPKLGSGELGALEGADVLLRDGRVEAVGKKLTPPVGARVVDVTGQIVLPGFVDIHTHLWQSSIRGACADQDLKGWIFNCALPAYPKIEPEDMYRFVRLSTADVLQTGVTTVVDWVHNISYAATQQYVRALDDSGVRFVYAAYQNAKDLDLVRQTKKELIDPLSRATFQVSWGVDNLDRYVALARELKVMLNVHVLEARYQRAEDPIGKLRAAGAFDSGLLMNHAVHLSDAEIALTAQHDVRIAHCPLSNMRLASGIARLPELRRHGVKIGLGLDGGTNDTSDMFNLMRSAVGLQRARAETAEVYPKVADALRLATMGGAEAIGMADRIGSLTPGKRADVITVNPARLNFAPRFDWTSQLVFNGQPGNVWHVFVDGQQLKADGALVGVSPDRLVSEAELAARNTHG